MGKVPDPTSTIAYLEEGEALRLLQNLHANVFRPGRNARRNLPWLPKIGTPAVMKQVKLYFGFRLEELIGLSVCILLEIFLIVALCLPQPLRR